MISSPSRTRRLDWTVGGFLIHRQKVLLIHHRKLDAWLAPGGHVDKNETPDEALQREFREEVGIAIEFSEVAAVSLTESLLQNLALPFHANVHSVGDHDHACWYYLVTTKQPQVRIQPDEIRAFQWLGENEIESAPFIWQNVKAIARLAFAKKKELDQSQKP